MKFPFRPLSPAVLFLFAMNLSFAQQPPAQPAPDKGAEKPKEEKKPPAPEEKIVQTKHSIKIGGPEIEYTASAVAILFKPLDRTPTTSLLFRYSTHDPSNPPH